jgi:hypothetical protein
MAVPVPPKRAGRPTDPLHIRCPELKGIVASSGVPCNRCIAHLLRGVDTTDHPLGSGGGDTGPVERSKVLASDAVAVEEVEVKARPDLHRRYHIDAVPIIVVADTEGVVRTSFTGPPSAIDLWAAVASVRDADGPAPGPEPPPPPLLA